MAETLGIVASGIAVAQLGAATGGAVLKLKQLWGQVKDAPETISELIERIDLISSAVWELEHQFTHSGLPPMLWDKTTAVRSIAYCRKALMKLSDFVDGLSSRITSRRGYRRKLGAAQVVLNKDEREKLEGHLRNALDVLRFAQDAYHRAILMATPDIVTLKLQQFMQDSRSTAVQLYEAEATSSSVREQDDGQSPTSTSSQSVRQPRRRTTSHWKPASSFGLLSIFTGPNDYGVEFRQPWWLAGLASSFTLHMSTYRSGWDVQVRLYSERPESDPVFLMAEDGDVAGLRSLFEQRQASPFDRDEYGRTLLHVEVTRFLFETGVDLTQTDLYGERSLGQDVQDLTRLLLPEVDMAETDPTSSELTCSCPMTTSWDLLQQWQPILCPYHDKTTMRSRLSTLYQHRLADPETTIFLLGPEWSTDPGTICNEAWTEYGYSLLHMVVANLTVRQAFGIERSKVYEFAKDVIRMTIDLHPLEPGSDYALDYDLPDIDITPFLRLILSNMNWESRHYLTIPKRANKMLQEWVKLLSEVGVDIEEYGQRELDILQDAASESFIHFEAGKLITEYIRVRFPLEGCELCLYGFTYGPNVEDWTILCNDPTSQFAGEFWDLMEDRPLEMPGAWFE
ncbi:hypothetical protein PG996_010842 [Apiospora saccharicola]|uniref:Fungal N-terminal domain-containing protein n=1 Tax=Apiospora saccharicola TaxID=335842 RepID=A0ABR1UPR9_9PEZI